MDPNSQQLVMGAAGSGSAEKIYVEDVFSTWLYTGTGSAQTITNGIDLSGKGGLTWIKSRSAATGHRFVDTARGATKSLDSSSASPSAAEATESTGLSSFSSTGFSVGADTDYNTNGTTYASWTFRKAAKFFDVVTYTGNGSNRTIAHNLGSVPGCIIVKRTDATGDWQVYHRSLANTEYLTLNTTNAKATGTTRWNSTTPTSTEFSLGTDATVNASGGTYVAYLFAHDAGGFGLTGSDSVIQCGSYTGNGSSNGPVITLGWEPQWLLIRNPGAGYSFVLVDVARGMPVASNAAALNPNTNTGENTTYAKFNISPTGFQVAAADGSINGLNDTYIYIAIRRGPMVAPTDATKVFSAVARTGTGSSATVSGGFLADSILIKNRTSVNSSLFASRLTGNRYLVADLASSEAAATTDILPANPWDVMDGCRIGSTSAIVNNSSPPTNTYINYLFRRTPGFFDVVTYTGTGTVRTISHNLGVAPELLLVKQRGAASDWQVFSSSLANTEYLVLNSTAAKATGATRWNSTSPTASSFALGTDSSVNASSGTYVSYLVASCPGVSKVGSYTGSATTKDIDCGFTNGARFVLIKRTDSTGDWYYWDTARGIVSGNDPYLLLNSTAAGGEATNTDYIDPLSSGFQISSTAPAAINANGGTYLYLAIA